MDNLIIVEQRTSFGVERLYPANRMAERFAQLLDAATLTRDRLKILRDAGFTIEIRAPAPAQLED